MYRDFLATALAAVVATGCAGTPDGPVTRASGQSRALHLMRAAGFERINDAHPDDASAAGVENTEASVLGASVYGAANLLDPPAGFSGLGAGALGFLSWLSSGQANPARRSHVIAWVPVDEAEGERAAYARMGSELREAMAAALEKTDMPHGYRLGAHTVEEGAGHDIHRWPIRGDGCSTDSELDCGYAYEFLRWEYAQDAWQRAYQPQMIGGQPAYVMTDASSWPELRPSKTEVAEWFGGFPDLSVYARMSAELPKWMAVYIAPRRVSYKAGPNKHYTWALTDMPMILHQGKAYYFIEPRPS